MRGVRVRPFHRGEVADAFDTVPVAFRVMQVDAEEMRRLVARGLAIVFITHKLNEALAYGDRITVLRLGRKVGEIGPERLKALDTVEAEPVAAEAAEAAPEAKA